MIDKDKTGISNDVTEGQESPLIEILKPGNRIKRLLKIRSIIRILQIIYHSHYQMSLQ